MIYYLGTYLHDTIEALSFLRLVDSISFRAILGAITSLMITILFGGRVILYFYHRGHREVRMPPPVRDHRSLRLPLFEIYMPYFIFFFELKTVKVFLSMQYKKI